MVKLGLKDVCDTETIMTTELKYAPSVLVHLIGDM